MKKRIYTQLTPGRALLLALLLHSSFFLLPSRAVVLTPFIAYTTDIVGEVSTNTVTIEAWASTNLITGVSTNLVLGFTKTYTPAASNGYFAGYLAPGNYRLTVSNISRGMVFGISSSASTQNLAQLAGVPIYAFQNFTLAQFSDVGTAAYSNTAAFFLAANAGTAAYSNTSSFLLHSRTNWAVMDITNSGTAAYSNASAFIHHTDTNWPLARITNAGTAAYSNASAFMDLVNNQTAAGLKTFSSTSYLHHAYITNLDVRTGGRANNLITTNGQNFGNAFSSAGSGAYSEQFGTSASASAEASTALGYGAAASGNQATALGTASTASGAYATALGTTASATAPSTVALGHTATVAGTNSIAIGASATANYNNSTALGRSATTTKSNQVVIGSSADVVTIAGNVEHLQTTGTNSFSDIAFRRYAITSLVNGDNAGVAVGTNTFVQVSGPTAAFTIHGINGSPNRDGHMVVILNKTTYNMTIAHSSGIEPTAAYRIETMTGADRATTGNGAAILLYSASESRWQLISLDQ